MTASRLPLYGTVAALALTRIAFGFQLQTVASLGPEMMAVLLLDFAALGALIGTYLAPGIFVALPSGFLARRFGDRVVALGSAWLIVAGGVFAAVAVQEGWGVAAIGLGRGIAGVGSVGLSVMQSKIAADRFGPAQLPSAMAVLLGAFPIGIGLAQVVLPGLSAGYGMAAAFWAGAGLAGMAAVGLTFAWTEAAEAGPRVMAWPSRREMGLVAIAGAIWMVYNAAWFNFMAWMPSLLAVRGHAPWVADVVLTLGTWANLPAMLLGGWLAVRLGRSVIFIAGTLICTLCVAGPAVVDAPLLWGLVFGTVASMPGSVIVELGALSCRAENRAVGMGIFYITYYIGGAVMPAVCGAAADWAGDPAGALVVAGAVALLGIPLWFWHARLRAVA